MKKKNVQKQKRKIINAFKWKIERFDYENLIDDVVYNFSGDFLKYNFKRYSKEMVQDVIALEHIPYDKYKKMKEIKRQMASDEYVPKFKDDINQFIGFIKILDGHRYYQSRGQLPKTKMSYRDFKEILTLAENEIPINGEKEIYEAIDNLSKEYHCYLSSYYTSAIYKDEQEYLEISACIHINTQSMMFPREATSLLKDENSSDEIPDDTSREDPAIHLKRFQLEGQCCYLLYLAKEKNILYKSTLEEIISRINKIDVFETLIYGDWDKIAIKDSSVVLEEKYKTKSDK